MKKISIILLLITFGLALYACGKKDNQPVAEFSAEVGSAAPDFVLKDIAGHDRTLSSFKGKVVLLEFWATWCPPCKEAIPEMVEFQRKYGEKGFTVLGISLDTDSDAAAKVARFSSSHGITYPVLIADEGISAAYNVMSIPTSFLVSKDGTIIASYPGYFEGYGEKVSIDIEKHL
jgi:cytochrome c biogenesis protein CcmG/thiol:disulfide interchange protein DsbE